MASSKRICPLRVDAVEKVTAKGLWNQKLKRTNPAGRFLNQDFAFALDLESMLLARPRENPFSTASVNHVVCKCDGHFRFTPISDRRADIADRQRRAKCRHIDATRND